ncbi:MAG TPA: DUF167 family protein [Acetobacteraceae bacterium]|nr:DUF167 family protein [Acetobacteraceae bacterium]
MAPAGGEPRDAGSEPLPRCAEPCAGGLRVAVKLRPGARRAAFLGLVPAAPMPGWPAARLSLAVTEPPEAGRANAAAIAALAAALGVKPGAVALIAGKTSRDKLFSIAGETAILASRLAALAQNPKA